MRDLRGKRVLVTGAGSGLGRDLSLEFASCGAEVVVTGINRSTIDETVRLIEQAEGNAVGFDHGCDQYGGRKARARRTAPAAAAHRYSREQCRHRLWGALLDVGLDQHRAVLEVNAMGPMIVTYEFLPDLIGQSEPHLVMIASASAILPIPLQLSYTASKWAALGFSDALRQELRLLGHKHVCVTSVCPSYLDTGLFRGAKCPRLSRTLPSAELARKIVRAVRTKKNYLLTPWIVKLAPLGKAILPLSVGEKLCDWMGIMDGMRDWVGHARAETPAAPNPSVEIGSDRKITESGVSS